MRLIRYWMERSRAGEAVIQTRSERTREGERRGDEIGKKEEAQFPNEHEVDREGRSQRRRAVFIHWLWLGWRG